MTNTRQITGGMHVVNKFLMVSGIIRPPHDPSIRKSHPQPVQFPGYYRYLYWLSIILMVSIFVGGMLVALLSVDRVRLLLLHPTDHEVILVHSDWAWLWRIVAMIGSFPISMSIYYPIYKLIFPKNFRDYANLRAYAVSYTRTVFSGNEWEVGEKYKEVESEVFRNVDVEKLQTSYKSTLKVFIIVGAVGVFAYALALNTYARFTPTGVTINNFWQVGVREAPYSAFQKLILTYEVGKASAKSDKKQAFYPKLILRQNDHQQFTLWDFNKTSLTQDQLKEMVSYVKTFPRETKRLEPEYLANADHFDYGWMISEYQQLYQILMDDQGQTLSNKEPPKVVTSPSPTIAVSPSLSLSSQERSKMAKQFFEQGFAIRMSTDDWQKEKIYYDKALAVDPNYPPALSSRGFIYGAFEDQFDKGANMLKRAIELDPNWIYAPYNLSLLYDLHGDWPTSQYWMEKALSIRPNDPDTAYFKETYAGMKKFHGE